jgi:hypothetical protein
VNTGIPAARPLWIAALVLALGAAGLQAAHQADVRYMAALTRRVDAGRALTDSERVEVYVDYAIHHLRQPRLGELHPWGVKLYYMVNPMHPGPADVVRWGADYRGPCGSYSRVVHTMLNQHRVPNRVVLLQDDRGRPIHTVLEVRVNDRWVVTDPSFGLVFHRRDGALATRADLAADPGLLQAEVDSLPSYDPRYDYSSTTLLNWQKIPVVLPAARALLVALLGETRVAGITRPDIWIWPRELLAAVFLLASSAFAGVAAWRSRRGSQT